MNWTRFSASCLQSTTIYYLDMDACTQTLWQLHVFTQKLTHDYESIIHLLSTSLQRKVSSWIRMLMMNNGFIYSLHYFRIQNDIFICFLYGLTYQCMNRMWCNLKAPQTFSSAEFWFQLRTLKQKRAIVHMREGLTGHKENISRWRSGHKFFLNMAFSLEFLESLMFYSKFPKVRLKTFIKHLLGHKGTMFVVFWLVCLSPFLVKG